VVEAAVSVFAMLRGALPPTHNLDDPDPDCALDHIQDKARPASVDRVMSNSFGFGGHNVSLIFSRPGREQARDV
jgi:3-oxoacyl-[acyl-carrier-protein] synthase II